MKVLFLFSIREKRTMLTVDSIQKAVYFLSKNVEFIKLYEVINKFLKFINKVDIIFISYFLTIDIFLIIC